MFTTAFDFQITLATVLFLLGVIVLAISIFILTRQAIGRDIQTIATETTKLAEKGISENIAGLVGNASSLINALHDLSKSNAGIGVFLVFLAIAMLTTAYFISKNLGMVP
ncbi:MAG TPA: hypothetical protein DF984_04690 [Anaerolineaceae bacterium]|jgi:hypothetical protein|nr:hypothetical protein [Anaerolineaceae bacterium]